MTVSYAEITMTREVAQFLAQPHKLLIDGEWVESCFWQNLPGLQSSDG